MNYGIYWRPKQPRNQYGYVNNGNTSVYSSNSLYGNNISPVGGDMIDVSQLSVFVGATDDTDGIAGIVPAPMRGEQNWYYLRGNGAWDYIPAAKWLYEWPKDLEPSGLGIDGNFHVSDTLSTLNLNVEGRAHFWELVIDKAKANGGQIMVSPSLFQIDYVDNVVTYNTDNSTEIFKKIRQYRPDITKWINRYNLTKCRARRVWMNNDDGMDRTFSEVEVGDMMRCRTFNLDGHAGFDGQVMKDVANTDYWTFVCGAGKGTYTKTIQTEEGEVEKEFDAIYMDLAFALTGSRSGYEYVPIDTLFYEKEEGGYDVELPENFAMPDIYNDLKKVTFQTLCGSEEVEEEYIEDEQTIDWITDLDFTIRGIAYITAKILGIENVYNSYSSLYQMLADCGITGYILYGSDSDNIESAVQKILGVDVDPYGELAVFEINYADNVVDATLNGDESFEESETGQYDPAFNYELAQIADRVEWMFGYGLFEPREGQQLACLGHLYDKDRQNAVVISSIQPIDPELVAPSIAQYSGIDVFGVSISQFRLSVIAKNGNIFTGKFMVKSNNGAYISVDDMIDLYITDIETGLETVGIHLDGTNSTIRMKGSVELHQHSDKDDDTLSVWDSSERKKVEIIPSEIPSMNEISQTTSSLLETGNITYNQNIYNTIKKESVTVVDKAGFLGIGRKTHVEYRYSITEAIITLRGEIDLGYIRRSDTVDLSNMSIYVRMPKAALGGYSDYSVGLRTKESTCTVKLTFDGQTYTYNPDIPVEVNEFSWSLGEFVDDYHSARDGKKTLRYEMTFKVCSYGYYQSINASYSYFTPTIWHEGSVNETLIREGDSLMQIGTNGMVYSVGNGDYFYAGNDGFEFNYKNNGLSFNSTWGMQSWCKPQIVVDGGSTFDHEIHSSIVICKPSSRNYGLWMPMHWEDQNYWVRTGQIITVFGFKGLSLYTWREKRFKIYRYDINNYAEFDHITFSDTVMMHTNADVASSYVEIYTTKLQFVVADDGYYVISGLTV